MAVFNKGLGLKNDVFCSRPFLTPLIGSKTSTNIWKHVGISQNTFQDTKITKIGLLDPILALLKCTQARKCCLKIRYFSIFSIFFHFFCVRWTCTRVEMNQCTKTPYWGHKQHHFWPSGTVFRHENGHIPLRSLAEKVKF